MSLSSLLPCIILDSFSGGEDENELRLITPGDYYYFLADKLGPLFAKEVENIGENGEKFVPFNIFLKSEHGKKYIANCLFLILVKNGNQSVHTQTLSMIRSDW